jgi:hypothetical protein
VANLVGLAGIEPACKELPTCGFVSLTNPFRPIESAPSGALVPVRHDGADQHVKGIRTPTPSPGASPWTHAFSLIPRCALGTCVAIIDAYTRRDSNPQTLGPEPSGFARFAHGRLKDRPARGVRGSVRYTRRDSNPQTPRPQRGGFARFAHERIIDVDYERSASVRDSYNIRCVSCQARCWKCFRLCGPFQEG